MKNLVRLLTSFVILLGITTNSFAQNVVKGVVVDSDELPLPGVFVSVVGTMNGVTTDLDGAFSIQVSDLNKTTLAFSCIGMQSQDVALNGRQSIKVKMLNDNNLLEEIVVVAYGTSKRANLTGAVSTVSDKEILRAPTMSISNIVGSRIAGVAAVQSSGQPGSDSAVLTMRGQGNIVYVIDGIRRTSADFNGLDPNEIESISILKDASAVAVYGMDANGAFIVTTKKGTRARTAIDYTGSVGISQNTAQQEWLDGPGYAYWYNKARQLDGNSIVFNAEQVQKMKDGVDGWGNTNWYDLIFGTGVRTHHNISATGGNEKVRYFTSIGYLNEKGNISNFGYTRYNLRSNIDAQINDRLSMSLGVAGRIELRNAPRYSANPNDWHNIPMQIVRALPYVPATAINAKDGKVYNVQTRTDSSPVNPIAARDESGYNNTDYSYIQSTFSLKYDSALIKGLSAKFQGAYDLNFFYGKILSKPYTVLCADLPTSATETINYVLNNDATGNNTNLSESFSRSWQLTTQSGLFYDRNFGKHAVSALALAETVENRSLAFSATGTGLDFIELDELSQITNMTGNGSEKFPTIGGYSGNSKAAGFVGRVNYSFDEKYIVEATTRYDGSYLFGGMNKRWILLPGASVGWRMDKEDWFSSKAVDMLKIRAAVGKTATSGLSPFMWRNTMGVAKNSVVIGGSSQTMMYAGTLGNPTLTWAQCMNYNLGVDANLWNGLLGVELDVFYKYEYDKLSAAVGAYPPSYGGYYFSTANGNICDYRGFDLTLTHFNHIGDFNYGVKAIWSYAYGKWVKYMGQADNIYEWQNIEGKQIGSKYGFVALGLLKEEEVEDVDVPKVAGYRPMAGYIKYLDRNGDGEVTLADDGGYVAGSGTPTHSGSVNLFGNWRGFDFDLLFSFGLGSVVALTGEYTSSGSEGIMDNTAFTKPFYHGGNSPAFVVENSWTPENQNAEFPRLAINNVSNNNGFASTWWYRKGDYLRLKTAQVGYSIPKKSAQKIGLQGVRVYLEGYNLLTFSELTKYNIDPEAPAVNNGYYPQQRTVTLGLKLSF